MTYIIHGATGAQGAPLLKRLSDAGKRAIAAVRSPDGLTVPSVLIDNASVESLVAAYRGADGVFIHLPQTAEAERIAYARNIVQAVEVARPTRVVISTSGIIVDAPNSALQAPADSAVAILVDGIQNAAVSTAVIAPRLYLENLLLPMVFDSVRSEGVLRYPIRADFPVSWSSHLDVAEVAERLFENHVVTGIVGVGQLPGLVGADLAAGMGKYLGRNVSFESVQPLDFRALLEPMLGAPAAAAVAGQYQTLWQSADNAIAPATCAQRLLGIHPRSVQQWLAETLR
ncbi:SDR family oxidoreductase [Pseudomonas citronellolis]|uniref:SDR family oxidoreductase n=1 Tax=Pseudomonas citronellolis TaxID=53408 RepID=UPI00248E2167|nr:NAD(P)H-binding protein [Pseudomonas citronellolis]